MSRESWSNRSDYLRYAEPAVVVKIVESDGLRDNNDPAELKLALLNALDRIAELEKVAHAPLGQDDIYNRLEAIEARLGIEGK